MKVKEIGGCWYPSTGVLARYEAYYYVKIEDRYVMLNRCLEWKDTLRGPIRKGQLDDCIMDIYACDDEKDLEEMIQGTIQYMERSKQYASEHFEGREEPLEMKNGREIDLNLANIGIRRCNNPYCDQTSYEAFYKYLIEKKREELLLDRLDQLQQTIRNSPERYSVEKLIEKYEEQSGTQLSKQQISGLKEVDDKIQTGLIIGRYNLEDYSNFLNSIPDLLSGKKILGYGHFDVDGEFWSYEEIDKSPSVEEMALYNTYTYHTVTYGGTYKRDIFRELSSQSVKKE